jgi:hypothetical protein
VTELTTREMPETNCGIEMEERDCCRLTFTERVSVYTRTLVMSQYEQLDEEMKRLENSEDESQKYDRITNYAENVILGHPVAISADMEYMSPNHLFLFGFSAIMETSRMIDVGGMFCYAIDPKELPCYGGTMSNIKGIMLP